MCATQLLNHISISVQNIWLVPISYLCRWKTKAEALVPVSLTPQEKLSSCHNGVIPSNLELLLKSSSFQFWHHFPSESVPREISERSTCGFYAFHDIIRSNTIRSILLTLTKVRSK